MTDPIFKGFLQRGRVCFPDRLTQTMLCTTRIQSRAHAGCEVCSCDLPSASFSTIHLSFFFWLFPSGPKCIISAAACSTSRRVSSVSPAGSSRSGLVSPTLRDSRHSVHAQSAGQCAIHFSQVQPSGCTCPSGGTISAPHCSHSQQTLSW